MFLAWFGVIVLACMIWVVLERLTFQRLVSALSTARAFDGRAQALESSKFSPVTAQ